MKTVKSLLFLLFSVALLFSYEVKAQGIGSPGQIISSQQADLLFGPAIKTVKINKKMLVNIARYIGNYLLFNVIDDQLVVLDAHRNPIYPANFVVDPTQEFHVFDVRKVNELLNINNATKMNIELRANAILTITVKGNGPNGIEDDPDGKTMEYAVMCPPFCVDN